MTADIVDIKSVLRRLASGFSFRSKIEHVADGDAVVIQMKDLQDGYTRIGTELTRIRSTDISAKYLLQKNDILFLAKGANNFAIEYQLDLPIAVAASAFFVLRPNTNIILPSYLAWYINQPPVQKYLKEKTAGTYIPNVNKDTIEAIAISLPPMDIQQKIVIVEELRKKEDQIMKEISSKRKGLVSGALLKKIENSIP